MKDLSITIPVLNEEKVLAHNIISLVSFVKKLPYSFEVVIADNGSTDGTLAEAKKIQELYPEIIKIIHLGLKGRGRALKKSWLSADARLVGYMDVDLSTNLNMLPALIEEIQKNGADIATGSRLLKGSNIKRSLKREIISQTYNFLVKIMFQDGVSDHQCGFKLLKKSVADKLIPKIENNAWFFDTELLLLAKKEGLKVVEIPVQWIEDLDSRVNIIATITEDIIGLIRIRLKK